MPKTLTNESPTTSTSRAVLEAHGIKHSYGSQQVLHGVDLQIGAGESVALVGPSGSGKTTLLHILSGIAVPNGGRVTFRNGSESFQVSHLGHEARAELRRTTFGMVFQANQLLAELTAVENVALPLMLAGQDSRSARAKAAELFTPLGLAGLADRRPGELSGGQQQRVAIARALAPNPKVLFADEPTGALDRRTAEQVMELLLDAQRRTGSSLVVVTHDPDVAERCDRVVALRDGRVS